MVVSCPSGVDRERRLVEPEARICLWERMGLVGTLVKRLFSFKGHKASSPPSPPGTGRDNSNDRNTAADTNNRWILTKLNFCGDDFHSIHVEADDHLPSLVTSGAAATPKPASHHNGASLPTTCRFSIHQEPPAAPDRRAPNGHQPHRVAVHDDTSVNHVPTDQHRAALLIQAEFRGFLARRQSDHNRLLLSAVNADVGTFDGPSLSTFAEPQPGDSTNNFALKQDNANTPLRLPLKTTPTQPSTFKQEWDDSKVSSNISKLRIQNRMEAMTRRERALAYAFSQQLRVCSAKKKHAHDSTDQNMGWNWLERWMATRFPESSFADDCSTRHLEHIYRPMVVKKRIELALAEKESCGSNDVSVNLDSAQHSESIKQRSTATKNKLKAPSRAFKRNNTSNCHHAIPSGKMVSLKEAEKPKQNKQMQPAKAATDEIRCSNASKKDEIACCE